MDREATDVELAMDGLEDAIDLPEPVEEGRCSEAEREREEMIHHIGRLQRRNDLLQARLDAAQGRIARMQKDQLLFSGKERDQHEQPGVRRDFSRGKLYWRWFIRAAGQHISGPRKHTKEEAEGGLAEVRNFLGLDDYKTQVAQLKSAMVRKVELYKANKNAVHQDIVA